MPTAGTQANHPCTIATWRGQETRAAAAHVRGEMLTPRYLADTISSTLSTLTNRPDMVTINPSLMFTGACGDAFRRYASLFGGEIVMMLTYAESPLQQQEPKDWGDKVWFARLRAGGLDITGGDVLAYEEPRGFSMVVGVESPDEADRVFKGLADGGEVLMPLQATPWSPRYGVVRDPFGIRWEINCDAEPAG